VNPKIQAAYT